MKKLMKAIALATVMCMLMSVAAFASEAVLDQNAARTLNVTVTYEGLATDQVSLVVVPTGAAIEEGNILYVAQDAAVNGTATFTAPIADATVTAVDVYAGYAKYADANSKAEKVATNLALTAAVTNAAVVVKDLVTAQETGAEQTGFGIGMNVDITVPEGYSLSKVIWGVTVNGARKYTDAITVGPLAGNVDLGVAFLNGSVKSDVPVSEITEPTAIFLFTNGVEAQNQEVFTDSTLDAKN